MAAAAAAGPDARAAFDVALSEVDDRLRGQRPDLVLAFVGGAYADAVEDLAGRLGERGAQTVAGVTVEGCVVDGAEIEHPQALSLWAAALPGLRATGLRFPVPDDRGVEWPDPPDDAAALVVFADPFTHPADGFLAWAAQRRPGLPVVGGMASGGRRAGTNRLVLDGEVHRDGAVGVALSGAGLATLVSQGCRPVGEPFVVTGAEGNLLSELAGRPAADRLRDVYGAADPSERALMEAGLHIGIVLDEYAEERAPGDFLVRAVLGAQRETGGLAIGDRVEVGRTVQFHVRDAASADEDLRGMLAGFAPEAVAGGLLFTCNGRGTRLFGTPDHDASLVRDALGDVPLAGFFAAGEFGPVGGRSHLHGFTASLLTLGDMTSCSEAVGRGT